MPPMGERKAPKITDPKPLGIEADPEMVELFAEFAKNHDLEDVYLLWKDPEMTNPTIRQQMITFFTAPNGYGFSARKPYGSEIFSIHELVDGRKTTTWRIDERLADRPELPQELAQGFLYWLDMFRGLAKEPMVGSHEYYKTAIRELLPLVDEETADRLFAYYPIKDLELSPFKTNGFGYKPTVNLLEHKKMPKKYKDAALQQWFDIATQEEEGTAEPRAENERAIKSMAKLTYSYLGDNLDRASFTKVIRFLEDNTPTGTQYCISRNAIAYVYGRISNKELRFQFVNRHLFGRGEPFRIHDGPPRELITWMHQEAEQRDLPKLKTKIENLVRGADVKKQRKIDGQIAEAAIVAKLKE